jgi:DNA-binding NarL/FixJ family response regulator
VTRVFILSPLPALRAGLRAMLAEASPFIEVMGDAGSMEDAGDAQPDVWLASDAAQLPALAASLNTAQPPAVVVLADSPQALHALAGVAMGGAAVLPADVSPAELQSAIHAAANGMLVMPFRAGRDLLSSTASKAAGDEPIEQPLTQRELEVLERVSRGLPSKLIAQQLDVAESTIKFHLSSIYAKLGVSTRTEAVSKAARLGLITL